MSEASTESGLGSLSQAARSKQLGSARKILIFIGVITILAGAAYFFLAEVMVDNAIDNELKEARAQNLEIDEVELQVLRDQAVRETKLLNGVSLAIGILYIVMGINVKKYPVPITITALVLYIGCWAVFGLMDPETMFHGIIVTILIIAGLFKAIQAAVAYEKEEREAGPDQPLAPLV